MGFKITRAVEVGEDGVFTRLLNSYLKNKLSFHFPRERIIRPSEIHKCTREILYNILGVPTDETISENQQRIFDNGTYVHKRYLKSYLPKMGCVCQIVEEKNGELVYKDFIEVSLHNDALWLKGSPDAVIFSPDTGLNYVFELKSMRQESFYKLKEPDFAHVQQVHLYMLMTGLNQSILFYENKNTQTTKEFVVKRDENLMKDLLDKISIIQKYVQQYDLTGKVPGQDVTEDLCQHCQKLEILDDCISTWKRKR